MDWQLMAKWSVKTIRREMLEVLRNETIERVDAENVIAKNAGSTSDLRRLADLSLAVMDLGKLDAARGALRILDGDLQGWQQLESAFLWKLLELKALKAIYAADIRSIRKPRSNPRDLGIVALHGLTFRRSEVEWCIRELRTGLEGGAFGATRRYPLAAYALWLGEKATGHVRHFENAGSNVYRAVVDAWSDDVKLRSEVARLCDYHVRRTIDTDDSELWLEFEFHPYPLFPVEYLALLQELRREGRDIGVIDHELLSTPLAVLPVGVGDAQIDSRLGWLYLSA